MNVAGNLERSAMKSFLKSRLSAFKVPKEYIPVEELPKNAAGKILKRELKKNAPERLKKRARKEGMAYNKGGNT